MLQVQEDGVLAHKIPQQLGHVGDAVWDDGQPLPAHRMAPGQALGREQSRQISWGLARGCSALQGQPDKGWEPPWRAAACPQFLT